MVDLNKYLAFFLGENLVDKNDVTELNEMFLNNLHNSWFKQSYVQGFYYESISFKESVNMFEHMEISESIWEGLEEHSYKKITKRGEAASSKTQPVMGESADKHQKQCVDFSKRE